MEFNLVNKAISTESTPDNVLHIKGIANTGVKDIQGDTLTQEALKDICNQALNHNLHLDHDKTMNGVLGPITKAELTQEGLEIHADVLEGPHQARLKTLLSNGVKLGMSVRGYAKKNLIKAQNVIGVNLTEISITPLPVDQGTMGSVAIVKSLNEITTLIEEENNKKEQKEGIIMSDGENMTEEKTIELINQAFNDRREEFLETIRYELKTEYETILKEIKEKIDSLEGKIEAPASKEGKEGKEGAGKNKEGDRGDEGDEGDPLQKSLVELQKSIESMKEEIPGVVNEKIEEIFSPHKEGDLFFKSAGAPSKQTEGGTKKAYTPKELAKLLSQ